MIQVAAGGLTAAAGGAAAGAAGVDQVLELAAGPVPVLGLGVVTRAADDRGEGEVQEPQELRSLRAGRTGWFAVVPRAVWVGWVCAAGLAR